MQRSQQMTGRSLATPKPVIALLADRVRSFALHTLTAIGLIACCCTTTHATVVYLQGKPDPVVGYFVEERDNEVVIREVLPTGLTQLRTIPRAEILQLLNPVDGEQLEELSPDQPTEYLELAEALSAKVIDPEAIELAIRLYLIAIQNGSAELQESAYIGLIHIARNDDESRRFRALAYRSQPQIGRRYLVEPNAQPQGMNALSDEEARLLVIALQSLRNGKRERARQFLRRPEAERLLDALAPVVTAEFYREALVPNELETDSLPTLVRAELVLLNRNQSHGNGQSDSDASDESWGETYLERPQPTRPLRLENATEFDPRESIFRDGLWRRP